MSKRALRLINRALERLEPLVKESHEGVSVYPNQLDKIKNELITAKMELLKERADES